MEKKSEKKTLFVDSQELSLDNIDYCSLSFALQEVDFRRESINLGHYVEYHFSLVLFEKQM